MRPWPGDAGWAHRSTLCALLAGLGVCASCYRPARAAEPRALVGQGMGPGAADQAAMQLGGADPSGRLPWETLLLASGLLAGSVLVAFGWRRSLARRVAVRTAVLERELAARERIEAAARAQQAQRRQAAEVHRMATLGAVVSSVAHEVNNPNHAIMLNLPVLRAAWQDAIPVLDQHVRANPLFTVANIPYADMRDDVLRLIDEIHHSADRIRAIISGLRTYAREHSEQELRAVDVEAVLTDAVNDARPAVDAVTDVFLVQVETPLRPVRGNRLLLAQVFASVLTHAARGLRSRQERIELRARSTGGEVVVEVRDQGRGMTEAEIVQLNQPFHQPGGSLDLAMASWIVRQHGGALTVESRAREGTILTVKLPAADA